MGTHEDTFQKEHESVVFKFGGPLPPLEVCGLSTSNVDPPAPFQNLTSDCHPIATRSRRYTKPDQLFIDGLQCLCFDRFKLD